MPQIVLETFIIADIETCFDLMRDTRIHTETTSSTDEKVVAGFIGTLGLGQTVTFEATHFGMRQRLTVEVVEFERPRLFVDEMIDGRFKTFRHAHEFSVINGGTMMRDTLTWVSPLGILGRIVDKLVLRRHLQKLVSTRNEKLKMIAENHGL